MADFDVLAATWPAAETVALGPWTLRRGMGGGNRVSAATLDGSPVGAPGGSLGRLSEVEAAMRGWGQRPLVLLRPGEAELDDALAARGYVARDGSVLLAAAAADLAGPPVETAIDCDGPLRCMAEIWAAGGVGPARLDVMARAAGPKTWLLGRLGDRPAACAFVAVHGGVAMLHALEVEPAARRRGVGALLTRAAARWARDRGAPRLALAVTEANAVARALYAGLGMAEVARYHYREAPTG